MPEPLDPHTGRPVRCARHRLLVVAGLTLVSFALASWPARPAGAAPTTGAAVVTSGRLSGLRYHEVAKGEGLKSIGRKYGIPAAQIRSANGMTKDTVYLGKGNDFVNGAMGPDWIYGGKGNDLMRTGQGSDHLWGGEGKDRLSCAESYDVAHWTPGDTFYQCEKRIKS